VFSYLIMDRLKKCFSQRISQVRSAS